MSREIRTGILVLVAIIGTIIGYKYVKGNNLLSKSTVLKTKFSDVSQLTSSSPVYIRGLKVGHVSKVDINRENLEEMIVTFRIDGDYGIPKNAEAILQSEGIVGGSGLAISYDHVCTNDCAENGDILKSKSLGLLGSLVGSDEISELTSQISETIRESVEAMGDSTSDAPLNKTIRDLSVLMNNLVKVTENMNNLVANSSKGISQSVNNMAKITDNLAKNDERIDAILANIEASTKSLKDGGLDQLSQNGSEAFAQTSKTLDKLEKTLGNVDKSFAELNSILKKIDQGDGTLSQLMNDKALYTNLESTSKNLSLLLQDLRLNPSRYIKVSVFGKKKNEDYTLPEEDPAYKD